MPSTAIAGRAAGNTTCQTTRQLLAPSTLAASMISSGSAWIRYCRMKNTPNALTSDGKMTACSWSVQSSLATIMYSGMMLSCGGTIIVPITSSISAPRPLKRSLAKANPAIVDRTTTVSAEMPATIVVLRKASPRLASVQADSRFLNRFEPNQNGGGARARRWVSREAAIAVHTSGNSETIVNTIRIAYATGPPCRVPPARADFGRRERFCSLAGVVSGGVTVVVTATTP
ncbi:hypothetical protein SHIRM173S_11997 [Streptomyces hirsutus]